MSKNTNLAHEYVSLRTNHQVAALLRLLFEKINSWKVLIILPRTTRTTQCRSPVPVARRGSWRRTRQWRGVPSEALSRMQGASMYLRNEAHWIRENASAFARCRTHSSRKMYLTHRSRSCHESCSATRESVLTVLQRCCGFYQIKYSTDVCGISAGFTKIPEYHMVILASIYSKSLKLCLKIW